MRPLREQGDLVTDFSGPMDYCALQRLFDELMPAGAFRSYWKSHFLGDLPDELIDAALANAAAAPSDYTLSSLWNIGAATAAVPADATALGDRSMGWMYSINSVWTDAADDGANIAFTRKAWDETRRFAKDGRLYLNFAGHGEDNAELVRDAFGKNYRRARCDQGEVRPGEYFPLQPEHRARPVRRRAARSGPAARGRPSPVIGRSARAPRRGDNSGRSCDGAYHHPAGWPSPA